MALLENEADAESLLHLARGISSKAQEIIEALQQQGLPQPSLGPNAPAPDFIPALDTRLQGLRRSLVSDARLLADTFTGTRKLLDEQLQFSVGSTSVVCAREVKTKC